MEEVYFSDVTFSALAVEPWLSEEYQHMPEKSPQQHNRGGSNEQMHGSTSNSERTWCIMCEWTIFSSSWGMMTLPFHHLWHLCQLSLWVSSREAAWRVTLAMTQWSAGPLHWSLTQTRTRPWTSWTSLYRWHVWEKRRFFFFCQNLLLQSLWSKALCQAGLQQLWLETWEHCLLCCVMEVMWSSLTCMPMKSMAVQILAGSLSMACVCHTDITDLKMANVYGFLQCHLVFLNNVWLFCKSVLTSHFVRWRQRLRLSCVWWCKSLFWQCCV